MKRILFVAVFLAIAVQLRAQSNAPVRLALISETDPAATAADILTAKFSSNKNIQLLERDQISKVYREQGLSKANTDYLKLGQILGADGLLLLQTATEATNQFLNARLVAVKPGVVLLAQKFAWPVKDPTGWSTIFAGHLDIFLPKLTVLIKDAIPISVVNLRSSVNSSEAGETERQLKLLTIQRLSREPQLFVLERQKMQLLTEEKELKTDDAAFWNGSYLLEGIVDQNGYSRETVTVNARLTPPKGGAPLQFDVRGSRTNLAEVVNQLAMKVNEALKVNSTVKEWNATDEAQQYFDEANWALKWGAYSEAQSAAESAWALGKQDLDCAMVRISSYANPPNILTIVDSEGGDFDSTLIDRAPETDRNWVVRQIKKAFANGTRVVFAFDERGFLCYSVSVANPPNPPVLNRMVRALELYRDFSRTMSPDDLKPNSAWYLLGVDLLKASAETLQFYYVVRKSQQGVNDKLADLRALSRWVDGWILQSSSVRDSYFYVSPNADKQWRELTGSPNIFQCEVNWGCFWQERPEDCVTLYRKLMSSPSFTYFKDGFISSIAHEDGSIAHEDGIRPCLIAWKEEDRNRVPGVWGDFVRELNDSTNQSLRELASTFHSIIIPAELSEQDIIAQYDEYWKDIQSAKANITPPQNNDQKGAWDLTAAIHDLFNGGKPSRAQVQELESPIATYESNLIRIMQTKSGTAQSNLQMAIKRIARMQAWVKTVLDPAPSKAPAEKNVNLTPSKPDGAGPHTAKTGFEEVQNVLLVRNYLAIPMDNLPDDNNMTQLLHVADTRWSSGRLLFNIRRGQDVPFGIPPPAIAATIFDPANRSWQIISYPQHNSSTRTDIVSQGLRSDVVSLEFFHGALYVVQTDEVLLDNNEVGNKEQILKYDALSRQWHPLEIPMQDIFRNQTVHTRLCVVNDHLYGVNPASIYEISKDDKETRFLASTRRRPAVSALDSLEDLGFPILFSAWDHSLCTSVRGKVYNWDGTDWHKLFDQPTAQLPEAFEDAVIFRHRTIDYPFSASMVWLWDKHQTMPQLALYEEAKDASGTKNPTLNGSPLWRSTQYYPLANASVSYSKSNLFIYVDRDAIGHMSNVKPIPERGAVDADLICLDRDCPQAIVIPLKYDSARGPVPRNGISPNLSPVWMVFTSDSLLIGNKDVPGIWAIPLAEVNAAIAVQEQIQIEQVEKKRSAAEQARRNLLAKYDSNHNGIIDPDEEEGALDDPAFIESELDVIDVNHNGWLDAEELAWFDANANKVLDPKEQAGIEIAQHLMAVRLLNKFDANGDGLLDRQEFNHSFPSTMDSSSRSMSGMSGVPNPFPDGNHDGHPDGHVDLVELETFLNQQTFRGLATHGMPREALINQMRADPRKPVDRQQMFKAEVEYYWQNPAGATNQPPFNGGVPPGAGFVPNGAPQRAPR